MPPKLTPDQKKVRDDSFFASEVGNMLHLYRNTTPAERVALADELLDMASEETVKRTRRYRFRERDAKLDASFGLHQNGSD